MTAPLMHRSGESVALARPMFEVLPDAAEACGCDWSDCFSLFREAMQVTAADYELPGGVLL